MAESLNTNQLLESFRSGDPKAYTLITEKFYSPLVEYSNQIIKNETQARDIASQSLEKLFSRSYLYQATEHYENFLYMVTRNASINYLRYLKSIT